MTATRNDLSSATRQKVCAILDARLADAVDLATMCKQAHWNVKGPSFIALHKLFDEVHEVVEGAVDEIAERVVALGGTAHGTARAAAKGSTLKEYPANITKGRDHAAALADRLAAFGKLARSAIDDTTKLGDAGTADLFTGVSRDIDKMLWFVEAHLQANA
ncbi:MAG: DNA starvation/stationary phase protection protein Dps [Phycisphaerales bacterium]